MVHGLGSPPQQSMPRQSTPPRMEEEEPFESCGRLTQLFKPHARPSAPWTLFNKGTNSPPPPPPPQPRCPGRDITLPALCIHYLVCTGMRISSACYGIELGITLFHDGSAPLPKTPRAFIWGRCHGGRRPSSDDSFHSPTIIPPSALEKPTIS